jgi:hypothetical protein
MAMIVKTLIKRSEYHDSVSLMLTARELFMLDGIREAAVVIETGILPQINAGIAHKNPGVGMVGAGILRAPEKCFKDAFEALQKM